MVALKSLAQAKSRFVDLEPTQRQQLVWAMALDTMGAVAAAVDQLVLVTAEPTAATRLQQAGLGSIGAGGTGVGVAVLADPDEADDPLNAAFRVGVHWSIEHGCDLVACVMADLPSLTPMIMDRVLVAAAAAAQPIFIRDASGIGTTMLVGRPRQVTPRFGGPSARRHLDHGAIDLVRTLDQLDRARIDVDDHQALDQAYAMGLQPETAALVAHAAIPAGSRPGSMLSCGYRGGVSASLSSWPATSWPATSWPQPSSPRP